MEHKYKLDPWKRIWQTMEETCREPVLQEQHVPLASGGELPILTFPLLSQCDCVQHCFTTRAGE